MKKDRTMWIAGLGVGALAVGGLIYVLASKKEEAKPASGGGGTTPPQPDRVPPAGVELWTAQAVPFSLAPGKQYRVSAPQFAAASPESVALNGLLGQLPGLQVVSVIPADWPEDDKATSNARYQVTLPANAPAQQVLFLPAGVRVWVKS